MSNRMYRTAVFRLAARSVLQPGPPGHQNMDVKDPQQGSKGLTSPLSMVGHSHACRQLVTAMLGALVRQHSRA
jgi:hypothetical protein